MTTEPTPADPTEGPRRALLVAVNAEAREAIEDAAPADPRKALEARHGRVWDTAELQADFAVLGFLAPFVVVRRKADDARGSLEFCNRPRFYFNWSAEGR
jgi:hypothetical protein